MDESSGEGNSKKDEWKRKRERKEEIWKKGKTDSGMERQGRFGTNRKTFGVRRK